MSKPITLGVFLPESAVYPLLSPNFLAGIELYLREQENEVAGRSVKIVTEHLALNPNRTPEKLQRAISVDRIDFALGCVGAAALSLCRETLEQYQIPMIAATAGASVPKSREMGPFIYRTSLGLWQSNYAMAARAVQQHGPRAELVPIMLDAGYDSNYAVHCGFESRGGKVERWHMADGRDFTLNVDPVIAAVREANPDFIFVNACGPKAVGVVRSFLTSGLLANRPLHGSAFTFEGPNALALGEAAVGMRSAHGWAEGLSYS